MTLYLPKEGKDFLVEMQYAPQEHFFERALYYTSFPIMKQGKKAQRNEETGIRNEWNYELDGVYFLGVLNFRYEDDELIEHRYLLREATTGKTMTDKLKFVFVEVEKFNKSEDELATDFDKWLFILKNLSKLLERPAALRDKIFSRLFDVAEYASLDNIDKQNYVKAMTTARDTHNQIEYAKKTGLEEGLVKGFEKGRAEGLEEGLEKGREDAKQLIAINFLKLGTPCEVVAKATGLSLEEVTKIKESSGR